MTKKKNSDIYSWLTSLPNPLFKFANRAKILTGKELLKAINDNDYILSDYINESTETIMILKRNLEAQKRILHNFLVELEQCNLAWVQYHEIQERDGKVEP